MSTDPDQDVLWEATSPILSIKDEYKDQGSYFAGDPSSLPSISMQQANPSKSPISEQISIQIPSTHSTPSTRNDGQSQNSTTALNSHLEQNKFSTVVPPSENESIRRMFSHMLPEKVPIIFGLLGLLVGSLCALAVPLMIGKLINVITKPDAHMSQVQPLLAITLILLIGNAICNFVYMSLLWTAGDRIVARVRKLLFQALIYFPISFYDSNRTGDLLSRLSIDVNSLNSALTTDLAELVQRITIIVGAVVYMFYLSWDMTLGTFIVAPIIGFTGSRLAHKFHEYGKRVNLALSDSNIVAEETLSAIRTVRSLSLESVMQDKFNSCVDQAYKSNRKMKLMKSIQRTYVYFLGGAGVTALLYVGASRVVHGHMSSGDLLTFVLFGLQLGQSVGNSLDCWTHIRIAAGSCERVLQLIEEAKTDCDLVEKYAQLGKDPRLSLEFHKKNKAHNAQARSRYNTVLYPDLLPTLQKIDSRQTIKFNHVRFAYPSRPNHIILHDLNFDIPPKTQIAFVGSSGSGKSTCVSLMERMYRLSSGSITLGSTNINSINEVLWRASISYVEQRPNMFNASIRDNILMAVSHFVLHNCEECIEEIKMSRRRRPSLHDVSDTHLHDTPYGRMEEDDDTEHDPTNVLPNITLPASNWLDNLLNDDDQDEIQCPCWTNHSIPLCRDLFGSVYTMKDVIDAATAANADTFIQALPNGYQTFVGERGIQLSGGQLQRVAIARAVIQHNDVLILDEASSALDSESERLVQNSLDRLMQGKTTIIIAHRLSTINHCDMICVFKGGAIIEQGTYTQLLEKNGMFKHLVDMQQLAAS